jgi:hypothetical protein
MERPFGYSNSSCAIQISEEQELEQELEPEPELAPEPGLELEPELGQVSTEPSESPIVDPDKS